MTIGGKIWENTSPSTIEDANGANDISSVTTTIGTPRAVFDDGFDSGDTTMWSYCTCWPEPRPEPEREPEQ